MSGVPRGAQGARCVSAPSMRAQLSAASRIRGPRPSLQGSGSTSDAGRATLTGRLQAAGHSASSWAWTALRMDAEHAGPRRKLAGEPKFAHAFWDWRAV